MQKTTDCRKLLTLRGSQPDLYERRSRDSMAAHVRAMLAFEDKEPLLRGIAD